MSSTTTAMRSSNQSYFFLCLTIMFLLVGNNVDAFRFDADTRDDCGTFDLDDCRHEDDLYFSCPVTCAKRLARKGSIGSVEGYPDEDSLLYNLDVVSSNGTIMSLEDYSGHVTLFAVVPLLPGMAQFNYELLEHLQTLYKDTVQVILLPALVFNEMEMGLTKTRIRPTNPNILLLKEMRGITPVPVIDHLLKTKAYSGSNETKLLLDRPTMFIVSANGEYVERTISPTLTELEHRLGAYSVPSPVTTTTTTSPYSIN